MERKAIFPDPEGGKMPLDLVPKASYVKGLLACTGIWMAGGRFGVTWKLVQAAVRPPTRLVGTGTCHIDDDSDDEEALDALKSREAKESSQTSYDEEADTGPTFDDDDDEDEAEAEAEVEAETPEPEQAPEPVKKKKKKVVRRKKKADA